MKDTLNDSTSVIEARNLNLVFQTNDGPVHALKDVNLSINRGEFVSFIGPSGCGKTTFLRAIEVSRPAAMCRGRDGVGSGGFLGFFVVFRVIFLVVLSVVFLVFVEVFFVVAVLIFVVGVIVGEGLHGGCKTRSAVKVDQQAKRGEHGVVEENRLWIVKGEGGQHGRSPLAEGMFGRIVCGVLAGLHDGDMTVAKAGGLARGMA